MSEPESRTLEGEAAGLTPSVAAFRHPAGAHEPMPAREEFDQALQHAQRIDDPVFQRLPQQGL